MTVLVVVSNADEAAPLVRWGARFARARKAKLEVFYPARGTKAQPSMELALEDSSDQHPVRLAMREAISAALATFDDPREVPPREVPPDAAPAEEAEAPEPPAEEAEAPGQAEGQAEAPPPPEKPPWIFLRGVSHPRPLEAVLAEIKDRDVDLLVVGKHDHVRGEERDLSLVLLEEAPCDTMLMRATGQSGTRCKRILAPASGGPHAPVSLRLSERMAKDEGGVVTPLYVEPDAGEEIDARKVGEHMLLKVMRAAGIDHSPWVVPEVVLADNPSQGIARAVKKGEYDLVLVGASNEGYVKRVLFGTVPNRLLSGESAVAVAVVRRARPLAARAGEAVAALVERYLPQLDRENRIELFERLQTGSRFDIDFFALISLSTAIASLGLLQDSAAVVIGAMLVAPLMTPMIGAGLGLVQGNVVLVREASRSIAYGFLTAVLIGYLLGVVFGATLPGRGLTGELLARGSPNALDLLVAFLSGVAAAYAVARPNLSGALPGVAIAAALVPPIGTVGISFAQGAYSNAEGAAALFGTNLVAIVLGAAMCFRAIGVQARKDQRGRVWARRLQLGLILTTLVITFPLGSRLIWRVAMDDVPEEFVVDRQLHLAIQHRVEQVPGMALVAVEALPGAEVALEVVVASPLEPDEALAAELSRVAAEVEEREVHVHLVGLEYKWSHSARTEVPETPQ